MCDDYTEVVLRGKWVGLVIHFLRERIHRDGSTERTILTCLSEPECDHVIFWLRLVPRCSNPEFESDLRIFAACHPPLSHSLCPFPAISKASYQNKSHKRPQKEKRKGIKKGTTTGSVTDDTQLAKKQLMRTDLWQRCGTHCNTKGQRLAASSHFRANGFPHSGWIKKQSPPKCGQILLCRSEFAALKQVLDGGGHREPQANISRS